MSDKIAVMIANRDRPTELGLLLESLWHQTYRNFDIFILDDCSGTPIQNYHFLMCMINKLKSEGNRVFIERTPFNYGVSNARQRLVEWALSIEEYPLMARFDDDVILDTQYIEKLLKVIDAGYDLASGVTPFMGQPQFERDPKFIYPVGNKVILDKEGNHLFNGDDCGMLYSHEEILPLHHFRSCALYKAKIHEKINYKTRLSKHGFREEQIFSYKCIINGFKLGLNTGAISWHLLTPSGGERFPNQQELVMLNQNIFEDWTKMAYEQYGDFIEKYNKMMGIKIDPLTDEEKAKSTNLAKMDGSNQIGTWQS